MVFVGAGSHPSLAYSDFCDRTLAVPEAKVTILQCFTPGACAGSPPGTLEAMEPAGWMHGLRGGLLGWLAANPAELSLCDAEISVFLLEQIWTLILLRS